jgi:hypothetical protein
MQLLPSGYGVGCQVPKPRSSIPFQGMYKETYENIFMLNKEAINEILKCCDMFITTSRVTSIELWKGFQISIRQRLKGCRQY